MLEFGDFAVSRQGGFALLSQRIVDHALGDDGACGVIRAGFRAQRQKTNFGRIDIKSFDQSQDGIGSHGVHALLWPGQPEARADDITDFVAVFARPVAPILQINAKRRHIYGYSANTYRGVAHRCFQVWSVR